MPIQVDLAGLSRQDFWMIFNWGGKVALSRPKAEAQQTGALKDLGVGDYRGSTTIQNQVQINERH